MDVVVESPIFVNLSRLHFNPPCDFENVWHWSRYDTFVTSPRFWRDLCSELKSTYVRNLYLGTTHQQTCKFWRDFEIRIEWDKPLRWDLMAFTSVLCDVRQVRPIFVPIWQHTFKFLIHKFALFIIWWVRDAVSRRIIRTFRVPHQYFLLLIWFNRN